MSACSKYMTTEPASKAVDNIAVRLVGSRIVEVVGDVGALLRLAVGCLKGRVFVPAFAAALACSIAVLVLPASAQAPGVEGPGFYMVMDPEVIYPGAIVRIVAAAPPGAEQGRGRIAGREFRGFLEGKLFWVYFAVDLDTAPGPYRLEYEIGERKGERLETVRPRSFEEERIEVAPEFVELGELTLARVDAKKARLEELWQKVTPKRLWGRSFISPAAGKLGSPFGLRRIFNGRPRSPHSGLDVKAAEGSAVRAANAGKVVLAEEQFFSGKLLVIDHGLGLYTYYAHLSEFTVEAGDDVERGTVIGRVGSSGRATGPHLHWGARLMGARVDPITLPGFVTAGAAPSGSRWD